jgi:diguanylate cyclase (GGDEF)-like protein
VLLRAATSDQAALGKVPAWLITQRRDEAIISVARGGMKVHQRDIDPSPGSNGPAATNGNEPVSLPSEPQLIIDEDPSDLDQTLADTEQTLADADQTLSDSDQAASDRDQVQAKADQRASDRDQAAADHDDAGNAGDGEGGGYKASRAERREGTLERAETASARAQTAAERLGHASARDENACLRDLSAAARDREAARRELAAVRWERERRRSRPVEAARDHAAELRARAATDRRRAATDRERAAIDRAAAARDREQARAELRHAQLDQLTGAFGRELGLVALNREIDRARHRDGELVLAYVDVDGLKEVNDRHGHAAGDALLRDVGRAIHMHLRSYDPLVRVGGDEFVCTLEVSTPEDARRRFQQISATIEQTQPDASISVGFATLRPEDTLEELTARGDRDLYKAKHTK